MVAQGIGGTAISYNIANGGTSCPVISPKFWTVSN